MALTSSIDGAHQVPRSAHCVVAQRGRVGGAPKPAAFASDAPGRIPRSRCARGPKGALKIGGDLEAPAFPAAACGAASRAWREPARRGRARRDRELTRSAFHRCRSGPERSIGSGWRPSSAKPPTLGLSAPVFFLFSLSAVAALLSAGKQRATRCFAATGSEAHRARGQEARAGGRERISWILRSRDGAPEQKSPVAWNRRRRAA